MRNKINAELEITAMEYPNKGVGFFEGKKVYVKHSIPGQTVSVNIGRKKKCMEGNLSFILKKAPYEIEPSCKNFGICGGCAYQNITYEKEIAHKESLALKLLEENNIDGFDYLGITPSPMEQGYKNKMELSFGDFIKDGVLEVGMRKRNSHYEVVTPEGCNIIDGDYKKIIMIILDFFRKSGERFHHKVTREGSLRNLIIRKGAFTGEIMVNIVTSSSLKIKLEPLCSILTELNLSGKMCSILHTICDSLADAVKPEKITCLFGRDFIYENLLDLRFKITPFSFFQTNSYGAEKLYKTVQEFVNETGAETVYDLYCGTGAISQLISGIARKVTGVEIVPEAVVAARENAEQNGITNCSFICGDVLEILTTLEGKPELIILDPPREGVHPKAIKKLIDANPENIIYVSCNPVTLARNLTEFTLSGYKTEKLKLCDMFPRTYHVECVVLLTAEK